jgi:hypothetical protein
MSTPLGLSHSSSVLQLPKALFICACQTSMPRALSLGNLQRRLHLKKHEPYTSSLGYCTGPHTILASTLKRLVR